jgi:peptide/nickel transport system permease protein
MKVARRAAFAVLSMFIIMTVAFMFIALTEDPNVGSVAYGASTSGGDPAEAVEAYREARNLNDPVLERYTKWMTNVATFDWGISYSTGKPVLDVLSNRLPFTLLYLVPSMVLSLLIGISVGLYSALNQHSLSDKLATATAYFSLGTPNFWLAQILFVLLITQMEVVPYLFMDQSFDIWGGTLAGMWGGALALPLVGDIPVLKGDVIKYYALPVATLTTVLLAGQLRYARAESLEYVDADFVKIAKAKGAGPTRVAVHILRNAAIPLVALFFTDMLSVLVLNIFVIEFAFDIPGFANVSMSAIEQRDLPLILGFTMVVALVGVLGNFLQDMAYTVLDPRVGSDAE